MRRAEEILYEAKPHIGTDRLPGVVKRLRQRIVSLGAGAVRASPDGHPRRKFRITGVTATRPDGTPVEIDTDDVLLAVGHSARDTFEMSVDRRVHAG
jgi:uncharacterized FAD-dependent dehydrogenase